MIVYHLLSQVGCHFVWFTNSTLSLARRCHSLSKTDIWKGFWPIQFWSHKCWCDNRYIIIHNCNVHSALTTSLYQIHQKSPKCQYRTNFNQSLDHILYHVHIILFSCVWKMGWNGWSDYDFAVLCYSSTNLIQPFWI